MTISGVLLIDKPAGWRSRQVVDAVGKLLGERKIGHAGTLDPAATGLLVLLIRDATKLSRFLMDGRKVYQATIRLGIETDTYDGDGKTVAECETGHLTSDQVKEALGQFRGTITQTPPEYSAIKIDGKPAYKYARAGQEVEVKPREITIYSLQITDINLPDVQIELTCSKGTYVRSLAHDLGAALGVGGHLAAIRRVESGAHHVAQAIDLEQWLDRPRTELEGMIIPVAEALADIPAIQANTALAARVQNGRPIEGEVLYGQLPENLRKGDLVQILTDQKLAVMTVVCPPSELGPPPWRGTQPLKYERVLNTS